MNLEEYLGEQLHEHWRTTHNWLRDRCTVTPDGSLVLPAPLAARFLIGLGRTWAELTAEEQRAERARAIAMIAQLKEAGHVSVSDRSDSAVLAVDADGQGVRGPGAGTQ